VALTAAIALAFVLGLDNLRAAISLGLVYPRADDRVRLALAFAIAEGWLPLVGAAAGAPLGRALGHWADLIGPLALGGTGCYAVWLSLQSRDHDEDALRRGWVLWGLPLALGIDNLAAGVALGVAGLPMLLSAVVFGAVSGSLALAGLYVGAALRRLVPVNPAVLAGVAMIALAAMLTLETG
jgi:manganese efflux pump family protein